MTAHTDYDPAKTEKVIDTVRHLLAQLGSTADEVAASLRKQGITGKPGDVTADPIANYLRAHGVDSPEVDLEQVSLAAYEDPCGSNGPISVDHPAPVRAFVIAFDNGDFQDLQTNREVTR